MDQTKLDVKLSLLDQLCIEKLELLDEIIAEKQNLERILHDGYIMLSKSRYISGQNSVSMLQVPSEEECIKPLFYVTSEQIKNETFSYTQFQVVKGQTKENKKLVSESESVTKYRGSSIEDVKEDTYSYEEAIDPIKWFGGLPSQSLRQSQKSFIDSLSQIVLIATLQNKLKNIDKTYKSLTS